MKTIRLTEPLKSKKLFGENVIEIIQIRAPCVKDLFGLDFTDGKEVYMNMVILCSRLSGIKCSDLMEMNMTDYMMISKAINELMMIEPKPKECDV